MSAEHTAISGSSARSIIEYFAAWMVAVVVAAVRFAAFVNHQHERGDAAPTQHADRSVDRVGLALECQPWMA